MKRAKPWLIAAAVLTVLGIYAYIYSDWFKPAKIQIYHRVTAARPGLGVRRFGMRPNNNAPVVIFGLDRKVSLTRVKVYDLGELATNSTAAPIWHLVSSSNSIPLKGFMYGQHIRGMESFVKGAQAHPLQPQGSYRLFIEAGSKEGQHDFKL